MRIAVACLLVPLACSCHEVVDNPKPAYSSSTPERREEVRTIICNYFHKGADIVRGPLAVEEVDRELGERGKSRSDEKRQVIVGGPDWDRMKTRLRPGDELYYYVSDPQSWDDLHGWEGYVTVRERAVVDVLPISIN